MDRRTAMKQLTAWLALLSAGPARADDAGTLASTFHRIYDDIGLRDQFFLFLQNIFHLYPEHEFHQLIIELVEQHADDRTIYEALLTGLPKIKTWAGDVTYALPALKKQKKEMARQSASYLKGARIDGYLEIGSTGRYVGWLDKKLQLVGPTYVCNDLRPTFAPVDLLERGQVSQVGTFLPLGDYDPLDDAVIGDASLDLVSSFIGFHHAPADRLDGFIASIHRVLRPGGTLLLREHDVVDETMDTFVALAHDVFNAGVRVSWDDNARQIRHFRSVADWTALLGEAGFRRVEGQELQAHDPTDNALIAFSRV